MPSLLLAAFMAVVAVPAAAAPADIDFMNQPQDLGLPDDDPLPGVDPPYGNDSAGTETGENLICETRTMEKTLWWSITGTGASIRVTTAGSHFDTIVAVYVLDGSGMRRIGCNDDAVPGSDITSSFAWVSTPGARYRIQVGGCSLCGTPSYGNLEVHTRKADLDGDGDFDDCNDLDPARAHTKQEVIGDGVDQNCSGASDRDDDSYDAGPKPLFDCDDTNVAIHPGAVDIAHDESDQNCDGPDNKDEDGDLVDRGPGPGLDCDDKNPGISPRRTEVPGDRIDEDCLGGPKAGALPRAPNIVLGSIAVRGGRRHEPLRIANIAKGYKVSVRCTGSRRCPRRQTKDARSTRVTFAIYDNRLLPPGAEVRISVLRPDGFFYGVFKKYRIRPGSRKPRQTNCQLHPDRPTRPINCSS